MEKTIIKNKDVKVSMSNNLIDSITMNNIEILNTTKTWTKKFPILFPAIASGKKFDVNNKIYEIQRHGFWNDIDFKVEIEESKLTLIGNGKHPQYPFNIPIKQTIEIVDNSVEIETYVENNDLPIQFGYHPALNFDSGNLKIKEDKVLSVLKNGGTSYFDIDVNNLLDLNWNEVDSFILKQNSFIIENDNYNLKVESNMTYKTLWRNEDKFICIEPWSNLPASVIENDNDANKNNKYKMKISLL